MTRYSAYYGSWAKGNMTRVEFGEEIGIKYLTTTTDRKVAYKKAQEAANRSGEAVTMIIEKPSSRGLETRTEEILPEK